MATKKKSTGAKKKKDIKETVYQHYLKHLLKKGEMPKSLFEIADNADLKEEEVSAHFPTVRSIEKHLWKEMADELKDILHNDASYEDYSAPEQLLAVHFTLIEVLKKRRSLVQYRFGHKKPENPWYLDYFKDIIGEIYKDLFERGFDREEFLERPMLSAHYHKAAWVNALYIIRIWAKDESDDFQTTDAAIEKSTNLLSEFFKKGPADTLIDFVKFAVQQKAY